MYQKLTRYVAQAVSCSTFRPECYASLFQNPQLHPTAASAAARNCRADGKHISSTVWNVMHDGTTESADGHISLSWLQRCPHSLFVGEAHCGEFYGVKFRAVPLLTVVDRLATPHVTTHRHCEVLRGVLSAATLQECFAMFCHPVEGAQVDKTSKMSSRTPPVKGCRRCT